jgi:hypothetical protein
MGPAELEYLAAALGKLADGSLERGFDLLFDKLRWSRRVHFRLLHQLRLAFLLDALVTDVIERPVSRGSKEIGLGRALLRQRPTPPPELEHHILHDLFGNSS